MRSIELFVGSGGMALGADQAGLQCITAVDKDRWACETLKKNLPNRRLWTHNFEVDDRDARIIDFVPFEGRVDVVTGGPPCQPFSMGGRHQAHLDDRDMFPEAVRAVAEIKPKAFIFENVRGLKRPSFANYLEYIRLRFRYPSIPLEVAESWEDHLHRLETLESEGAHPDLSYNILIEVLNAADYGVPQKRHRIFFVGFRSDQSIRWHFPAPTHSESALLWEQFGSGAYRDRHKLTLNNIVIDSTARKRAEKVHAEPEKLPWRTVRDAISDLPDPELAKGKYISGHTFQPGARSYVGHTGSPMDEPAKTLKAGVHGVPGGENMLRRSDGSVRYFTVRESARLQTFPDQMVFLGSWTETMRQLGNAVPVDLARIICVSVKDAITRQTA